MKKVLAIILTLSLLLTVIPAAFAEEYEVSSAVLGTEIPTGYTRHTTIKVNQGFYKGVGVTPWLYQRADIGSDEYKTLNFVDTGWYDGIVGNWVMGATQSPGSMHPGTAGDIVVTFVAPRDGKYMIEAAEVSGREATTDGTRLKVLKGTVQLFPDKGWAKVEVGGSVSVPAMVIDLKKDETLHFRVNCIENQVDDTTYWTQEVTLLNDGSIPADEVIVEEKKPVEVRLEGLSDLVFATGLPAGYSRQTSYVMEDAFSKAVGETPWLFQRADIGTDDYQTLEYVDNGWFVGEFGNWVMGATGYPGSLHPGTSGDVAVTFVAPFDGKILIEATTCNNRVDTPDGSKIRILLNDTPLYPTDDWLTLEPDTMVTLPAMALEVNKGDAIHFRVNCNGSQQNDTNYWKQTIAYIKEAEAATVAGGVTSPLPEGTDVAMEAGPWDDFNNQNTPGWRFQNVAVGTNEYADLEFYEKGWFSGSYQNWRPGSVYSSGNLHPGEAGDAVLTYTAPRDGTLVLPASQVTHRSEAGDGVKVQVLKNNTALFPAGGMMEVRPAETVNIPEMMFAVKAGDEIHFRVNCNANQSADATAWTPAVGYADGRVEEPAVFTDLVGHWAESAVMNLYEQGLVQGKGPNTYDPEASVTRAEFLTLALRAMGAKSASYKEYYPDVDINAWFATTVVEAYERDLIADELTPDGKFNPDQPILREEMTSVLISALQSLDYFGLDKTTLTFTDAATCAPWAIPTIATASDMGLILGNPDGTFNPKSGATRAEAAVILERFLKQKDAPVPEGTYSAVYQQPIYTEADLQKEIDEAVKAGASTVNLPEGAYRIRTNGKNGHLVLKDLKNFTVKGNNTTLLLQDNNATGINISGCENVILQGITMDYEAGCFFQGTVLAVAEDGRYVDVKMDPAYPNQLLSSDHVHLGELSGVFFREDGIQVPSIDNSAFRGVTKIGRHTYRIGLPDTNYKDLIKVGYTLAGRGKGGTAVSITNSSGLVFNDITIHSGYLGIVEGSTEGGSVFNNLTVVPGPRPEGATSDRVFSVNGSVYFARYLEKGPIMDHFTFKGNNDDVINIHGIYGRVAAQENSKTVIVAMGEKDYPPVAGDKIRFSTEAGDQLQEVTALTVEPISYTPAVDLTHDMTITKFTPSHYFRVTLDQDVQVAPRWRAFDASRAGNGMVIRNSTFQNGLRTIMLHANDTLIENCTFADIPRHAIEITPELEWKEGGYAFNVTIRNCTFRNIGYVPDREDGMGAGIRIGGDAGWDNRNIVIEGNTFENMYYNDIHAECITGLTLKNNSFGKQNPDAQNYGYSLQPAVWLDKTQDAVIEGNTFLDPARGLVKGQNIK